MFPDRPVSTNKTDTNFLIYLIDGIVNRSSSRICLYELDDAFSHKTQIDRSGEYRQCFILMKANCNCTTSLCEKCPNAEFFLVRISTLFKL